MGIVHIEISKRYLISLNLQMVSSVVILYMVVAMEMTN